MPTATRASLEVDGAPDRIGMLSGLAAYSLWGIFPLVFRLLDDVPATEILLHRVVWSLVVVLALLAVRRRLGEVRSVVATAGRLRLLAVAAVLISVNWLTYIWAVNNGHVVDAALGYYINPLLTVAIGVVVLRERLRRGQIVALGAAVSAVLVLTIAHGAVPVTALVLATSFAGYGYVKKAAGVASLPSLAIETAVLTPLALVGFAVIGARGSLAFAHGPVGRDLLLVGLGVVTATPLLLFATAARRIPLSTLGLLQYLTPTMQLVCGLVFLGESLRGARLVGFVLIWFALVVLAADAVAAERSRRSVVVALGAPGVADIPRA